MEVGELALMAGSTPTTEEDVTVTTPSVMALKPVTEGRHPVRVTAPTVTTPRPKRSAPTREKHLSPPAERHERLPAPPREQPAVIDPAAAELERAEIERRTILAIRIAGTALKTLVIGGMLLGVYLAVTQSWIAGTSQALIGWHADSIAPHLAMDPVLPTLTVGDGALFTHAERPSFMLPD